MRFKHQNIEVEIGRTGNAAGCTMPTSTFVKDELIKAIREKQATHVEFDGLDRQGKAQIVKFLLDGKPVRITNYKWDAILRKYYL